MQVDFSTAVRMFELLPGRQQSAYLHPYYVMADVSRDQDLEPVFFVYREKDHIFYHAFHLGKVKGTDFSDIQSPYPYGGPLSSTLDRGFLKKAWSNYISWCQEKNILAEFVRFHPLLENWLYYPDEIRYMRKTVWIDLEPADLLSAYTARVRTALRKAQKHGLQINWINDQYAYKTFLELYFQAMKRLQAEEFYYFPEEYFEKLQTWNQCYLAICFKGNEPLAAALFLKQASMMEYHLCASSPEGKKWSAANLLIHHGGLKAKILGCKFLYLGGGTDNRDDNSLLFFKSGFSKQRAPFKIGKIIHIPGAYHKMKIDWQERYGRCAEKTLFYRF